MTNEKLIWEYLKRSGFTDAGAAASEQANQPEAQSRWIIKAILKSYPDNFSSILRARGILRESLLVHDSGRRPATGAHSPIRLTAAGHPAALILS